MSPLLNLIAVVVGATLGGQGRRCVRDVHRRARGHPGRQRAPGHCARGSQREDSELIDEVTAATRRLTMMRAARRDPHLQRGGERSSRSSRRSARRCPTVDVLVVDDAQPRRHRQARRGGGGAARPDRGAASRRQGRSRHGVPRGIRARGSTQGYDAFVEMDADFSHDPEALPTLLAAAEGDEVVIGSRYVPGAAIPELDAHAPRAVSRRQPLRLDGCSALRVADSTAGFRVYRRAALEKMDYATVEAEGYGFQIEMTYRARRSGCSITRGAHHLHRPGPWHVEDVLARSWSRRCCSSRSGPCSGRSRALRGDVSVGERPQH